LDVGHGVSAKVGKFAYPFNKSLGVNGAHLTLLKMGLEFGGNWKGGHAAAQVPGL